MWTLSAENPLSNQKRNSILRIPFLTIKYGLSLLWWKRALYQCTEWAKSRYTVIFFSSQALWMMAGNLSIEQRKKQLNLNVKLTKCHYLRRTINTILYTIYCIPTFGLPCIYHLYIAFTFEKFLCHFLATRSGRRNKYVIYIQSLYSSSTSNRFTCGAEVTVPLKTQ